MTPRDCDQAREWLAAAVDAELRPEDRSRLDAHLSGCEACRAVAGWIPQVDPAAARAEDDAAPEPAYFAALADAVLERSAAPAAPSARRRWLRWPTLAPAALAVLALGVFTARQFESSPPTLPLAEVEQTLDQVEPNAKVEGVLEESMRGVGSDGSPVETGDERFAGEREELEDRAAAREPEVRKDEALVDLAKRAAELDQDQENEPAPPAAQNDVRLRQVEAGAREIAALEDDLVGPPTRTLPTQKIPLPPTALPNGRTESLEPQPTVRELWTAARAAEGTEREASLVQALLLRLDETPTSGLTRALDTALEAKPAAPRAQSRDALGKLAADAFQEPAAATLTDSVGVYLEECLPRLTDASLRQQVRAWLDAYRRE